MPSNNAQWQNDQWQTQSTGSAKAAAGVAGFVMVFILIWMLIGFAGFIMSIVCFGRKGTSMNNIIGVLISVFFGPLYWIYYMVMPKGSYCTK